jgi:poly(3-hydroxybutyrate) depolymerase
MRVTVDGVDDAQFAADLAARDVEHVDGGADIVFLGVADSAALQSAAAAWSRVAAGGALWIVYPRGVRAVTENDVLAAGRALGLLDVKVVRFSETHTALRFVTPRAAR